MFIWHALKGDQWCCQESLRKGWYLATTQPFDPSVTMLRRIRNKRNNSRSIFSCYGSFNFLWRGSLSSIKKTQIEGSLEEGQKLSFPDKVVGAVQLDLTVYSPPHHRRVK
mgnify:CR=1 FL=1